MLISEFMLAMLAFVFGGLSVITFSLYYAYRTRENIVRSLAFLLLSLSFLAALYYHSKKINLILIYRGAFGFENPSGLAFALMLDLLPFRGPPVYLFGNLAALASPEVYQPSGLDLLLVVVSKALLVAGLILLVYKSIIIYLGEVLRGRSYLLLAVAVVIGLISLGATVATATMVRGPLGDAEEARARLLVNAGSATLLALSLMTLLVPYSYFRLYSETRERSYLFQAAGFLLLTLFLGHLSGVLSTLTLDLAGEAITSFSAQASVMRIYIVMFALSLISSVLLAVGMILETVPAGEEAG